MSSLLKIDELLIDQHSSLSLDDECYYLMEYTPYAGYAISSANDTIQNLKKPMDRKGKPEWKYKGRAIESIANALSNAIPGVIDFSNTTIVPIPPSKIRTNPLYDDRVEQILRKACPEDADIKELLTCKIDLQASHEMQIRHSAIDLMNNFQLNQNAGSPKKHIVLFDDVIAGGTHYIAARRFLAQHFPSCDFKGVFIARRILQKPSALNDFADLM